MSEQDVTNPVAEAEAPELEVADQADAPEAGTEGSEEEAPEGQSEDDLDDLELDGKKYRVPKALIAERMMQADYTRKTQELAEQRRAQEAELQQREQSAQALREDFGKVHALEIQAKAFEAITIDQWSALRVDDPDQYRLLQDQHERVKFDLSRAQQDLTTKEQTRLQEANANRVKAVQEAAAVLTKDIPGWSPDYAGKLATFATQSFGVTMDELRDTTDPRMWKLIHAAYGNDQKAKTNAKVAQQEKVASVTPAAVVKGAAPKPTGLADNLPPDEWLRRRNAQARKRA